MQAFRGLFCLIMSTVQFLNDKCLWICHVGLHLSLVIGSRSPSARMCWVNLSAGCHFVSKDKHSSLGDPSLKPSVEPSSCSFLWLILQLSLRRVEWRRKFLYIPIGIYMYLQPRGGWGSQEGVPLTKQPGLVLVKKCPGSKFPPTTAAAATQPAVCLSPLMLPFSLHFIPSRAVQL